MIRAKKTLPISAQRLIHQTKALQLRADGHSVRGIAKVLGCGKTKAAELLTEAFAAEREGISQAKADLVETEILRCDTYLKAIAKKIKVGDTKAIETALKVADRRARLLGLDAPAKLEHSGTVMVIASDTDERL